MATLRSSGNTPWNQWLKTSNFPECRGSAIVGAIFVFMKFMLGTKEYMTQVFDKEGRVHAATVIAAGPLTVTQVKSKEKDGYEAVQVGYGERKVSRLNKPQLGHFKDLGNFRFTREFRTILEKAERGMKIDVSAFAPGDVVTVSSVSKGKGFQGVVKRHKFKGDSRTHGRKHSERSPGSIGGGGRAGGRVIKGMRMAGRMGGDRVTVKGLRVLQVDPTQHLLVIKGAIPGRQGTLVEVVA